MKCILCNKELIKVDEYNYSCPTDSISPGFTHHTVYKQDEVHIITLIIKKKYEVNVSYDEKNAFIWADGNETKMVLPHNKIDWNSGEDNIQKELDKLFILI